MKVFSKAKFLEVEGKDAVFCFDDPACGKREWIDKCDGKEVVEGWCMHYKIRDEWCIDVTPDDKPVLVFDRETYFKNKPGRREEYNRNPLRKGWVDCCHGEVVEFFSEESDVGRCGPYEIHRDWCIEKKEEVTGMAKCTMRDFIEKKIAVRTGTGENLKKFLEMCEEAGLCWSGTTHATGFIPNGYGDQLAITCGFDNKSHRYLEYSKAKFYAEHGWEVVDFSEFVGNTKSSYEIVIRCDGDKTEATMTVNGYVVKTATAKRNPEDKFDWRVGAETAFNRLWDKLKTKKPNRDPKVGDTVVIRKDLRYIPNITERRKYANAHLGGQSFVEPMVMHLGKTAKIVSRHGNNYHIDIDNKAWAWTKEMFETWGD